VAHFVLIEDAKGELNDIEVYCSDNCAQTSPSYAGWYGCMEVEDIYAKCVTCKRPVYAGAY
jgi:hypothetical protein